MIYLDNAATTKPCPAAINAVTNAMSACYGNAGSLHELGIQSEQLIGRAKAALLKALCSSEHEVLFTSCATESNNLALFGACKNARGSKIVSTAMEHPSAARPLDALEQQGYAVTRLSPKDYDDFEAALAEATDDDTALLSCMAVNNETGFAVDTERLYKLVKRKNPKTLVHIDGVQGFLKTKLCGDLISVSGHKIHAPKGIGALFVKKGVRVSPILLGGGQQKGLRSGTEPVELIAGLAAAAESYGGSIEHFAALKSRLLRGLSEIGDIAVNSGENCCPSIVNFSVRGVKSEIMLHSLEESGIYVSSGSACSRGKISAVPAAFGISDKDADCAIRVSFCAENTPEEIDALCEKLGQTAKRVRRR